MSKMKKFLAAALSTALMMSLASCGGDSSGGATSGGATSGATGETITWDFLDLDTASHPMVLLLNEWSDQIYEESGGQLKINIRVGGELPFTTSEYLDAVSAESVQMAGCMVTAISSYLDVGGFPACPYMTTDIESFQSVMDILEPYVDAELADYNVTNAMTLFYPTQDVYGKGDAPSTYTDLAGLKIRTSGAEQGQFWQAVGLMPTSIDAAEVSSALSMNVIDSVTTATMAVEMNKWYESLDWVYMCNSMVIPMYVVVNNDAFNALPEDVQEVFLSVTAEFAESFPERMQQASDDSLAAIEGYGVEVVWASDEDKAALRDVAVPLWEEYAEATGGDAPAALAEIKTALGL